MIKDENTNLRQEIKDLKANIKLNKEIMTSLYSTTESSKERDLLKKKVKNKF